MVDLALGLDRKEIGCGVGRLNDGLGAGHRTNITAFVRVSRKVRRGPAPGGQGVDCGEGQIGRVNLKKGKREGKSRTSQRAITGAMTFLTMTTKPTFRAVFMARWHNTGAARGGGAVVGDSGVDRGDVEPSLLS